MVSGLRRRVLSHEDGELSLCEKFLAAPEAKDMFDALLSSLPWSEEIYELFGKPVCAPRRVSWHGNPDAIYTYSGVTHAPRPWTPELLEIKHRVEQATQRTYNSVLANLYRDHRDSMGWHADKERELGPEPFIASLSLGATRLFRAQHKKSGTKIDVPLGSGSLLVMSGPFQRHWKHSVPKTRIAAAARINLTFREIYST